MFGFIRPVKSELRVREVERFQCVYCGLCHAIRARYGRLHTMFLSYDMTFLALILEGVQTEGAEQVKKRCDASPVKRRKVLQTDESMAFAADISVLLAYYKIEDTVADEQGMTQLTARFIRMLLRNGYQKAKAAQPQAAEIIVSSLEELAVIEREQVPSIDRAADPFARMLAACVPEMGTDTTRILRELFYHTGRWVYLIDACQDFTDDYASGSYNPVRLRYALELPILEPAKQALEITLSRSLAAIHAAFELLEIQRDQELIENIICLGLPLVTRQVLDGTYQSNGGQNRHGSL